MKMKRLAAGMLALMLTTAAAEGVCSGSAAGYKPVGNGAIYSEQMPTFGMNMSGMAAQVVNEVNMDRQKAGLAPLTVSPELTAAAAVRAQEIVEKFSHTRPDGRSWSTVSSIAYGENIAKGHNSANRVMAAWMTSEGHRRNILRASYGSIGVYALQINGVMYWVQLFGR